MNKKKLTFFTTVGDAFLRDLFAGLKADYDLKMFMGGDEKEFRQLLHDTHIVWLEWCNDLARALTIPPKMSEKYIIRLHSFEMFTPLPGQVDWNKVDKLIFVNPICQQYTLSKFKNIPKEITTVIPNGVNMSRFPIPEHKTYNKKVVFVGFINYKKGPQLLLEVFRKIWEFDHEFTFHIAGTYQDERFQLYMQNMMQKLPFKINFDGWQNDIHKYLEDKDFVISTSIFESFQYSLAEGMSQGLVPLCHSWVGSEQFYPRDYIFDTPEEAVEIVNRFQKSDNKAEIREKLRKHVSDYYPFEKQLKATKEMLLGLYR